MILNLNIPRRTSRSFPASGYLTGDRHFLEQVWITFIVVVCLILAPFYRLYAKRFIYVILLVRGMMYYRQALELQCFLELAGDSGEWFLLQILEYDFRTLPIQILVPM